MHGGLVSSSLSDDGALSAVPALIPSQRGIPEAHLTSVLMREFHTKCSVGLGQMLSNLQAKSAIVIISEHGRAQAALIARRPCGAVFFVSLLSADPPLINI